MLLNCIIYEMNEKNMNLFEALINKKNEGQIKDYCFASFQYVN